MTHGSPLAILLVFPWAACSPRAAPLATGSTGPVTAMEALVDSCHDGDTCRILADGGMRLNVRLAGIDAPEVGRESPKRQSSDQPLGPAARDTLNDMIRGRRVRIKAIDLDRYNRPVVEIEQAGTLVNTALVAAGLAEVYRRAPATLDLGPYLASEAVAKAARRGIWGLADYVPPAEFRARDRARR